CQRPRRPDQAVAAQRRPARASRSRRRCLLGDDAPWDAVTKTAGCHAGTLEMTAAQPPLPVLVDCREPADPGDRLGLAEIRVLRVFGDVPEYTRTDDVRVGPVGVRRHRYVRISTRQDLKVDPVVRDVVVFRGLFRTTVAEIG